MTEPTPALSVASSAGTGPLARRLLGMAGEPLPRLDFICRLAALMADEMSGSSLELWVDDGTWWIRARAEAPKVPSVCRVLPTADGLGLGPLCDALSLEPTGQEPGRVVARRPPNGEQDVTIVELAAGDRRAGWVVAEHRVSDHLARREATLLERVAEAVAMALTSQRAQAALRERVKELSCLYDVSQLARRHDLPLAELLDGVARLLPPAWQYPEVASARIELDGQWFGCDPPDRGYVAEQSAALVVMGTPRGRLVIGYRGTRPELDEGPFLVEERSLLEAVAAQIGTMISRREADEEHERLRDQLRHADRLATIGQLAAGVAHELNEPLGAVLGFTQLLRRQRSEGDDDWQDLGKIESAALHARDIVRQLLLFARRAPVGREPVDFDRVIDEALVIVEPRLRRAHVRVDRTGVSGEPDFAGDTAQLRQVLVNLLLNAVQAMPDGGVVAIRVFGEDSDVVLEVEDTGEGMSDPVRQQALLPFFTTRDVREGTGLGLAVVHGIVTGHGGTVEIRSRHGQGTRVVVRLPRDPHEERR